MQSFVFQRTQYFKEETKTPTAPPIYNRRRGRTLSKARELTETERLKLILLKKADERYGMEKEILYKYFSQIPFFKELQLDKDKLKRICSRLYY